MRIKVTDDIELKEAIRKGLKETGGYCPCRLEHIPENKCMCQEFLNQEEGSCHCGLYIKEKD